MKSLNKFTTLESNIELWNSQYITFTLRRPAEVYINDIRIPQTNTVRYHRLIFNRIMTWDIHVELKSVKLLKTV